MTIATATIAMGRTAAPSGDAAFGAVARAAGVLLDGGVVEGSGRAPMSTHAACPGRGWYWNLPAVQHVSWPTSALYVPGAHTVSFSAPTGQKVPTPHVMQSASPVIVIVAFVRVPPGHSRGMELPSGQNDPGVQGCAWVVAFGQKKPAGQCPRTRS